MKRGRVMSGKQSRKRVKLPEEGETVVDSL